MATPPPWAPKLAALIRGGNTAAAVAQIKVAPSLKDLARLQTLLQSAAPVANQRLIDQAIADQITALSSPRTHRSP
jgi:hypothetical protein